MRTSERGFALIKDFEGFSPKAYLCPAGKLTAGYGTTTGVYVGMTVTKEEAHTLLQRDLRRFEALITEMVTVHLSQEQFDALVSLVYNIGEGNFRKSTLLKRLNEGKYRDAALQFENWVYAGKKKLPGLVARRKAEKGLFLEGTEAEPVKPLGKSRTVAGGSAAGLALVASEVVTEVKDQVEPLVPYADSLKLLFLLVALAGIGLTLWARIDDRRKGLR